MPTWGAQLAPGVKLIYLLSLTHAFRSLQKELHTKLLEYWFCGTALHIFIVFSFNACKLLGVIIISFVCNQIDGIKLPNYINNK